jgi:hypothetical protein
VEGTLDASGTATDPIIFTSINDNTVGGSTGTGTPAPGDWQGIEGSTTSTITLNYAKVSYASTGIDVSAGSNSLVKVDSNTFVSNDTAVSISAAFGTNAQIENNSFSGNTVAIDASSNWTTATASGLACFYNPEMVATGNIFGGSKTPIVTPSTYDLITGGDLANLFGVASVEEWPGDWTTSLGPLREGNSDTITVDFEPCVDVTDPSLSYVAIAIPLSLDGSITLPIGG